MTFNDLARNLRETPLDDPVLITDVLDLFVSTQMRETGALVVLMCDEQRHLMQPIVIDEVEVSPPANCQPMLDILVRAVTDVYEKATLLIALARPGRLGVSSADSRWAAAIEAACAGRVELLAMYLVTVDGSLPITSALAA